MRRVDEKLDLERIDLITFVVSTAIAFVMVLFAALGFSFLGGEAVVYVFGYAIASAAHAGLAALIVGLVVEIGHGDWTNFGLRDHVVMAVSAALLAIGLFFLDRWVVNLRLSSASTAIYFALAGVTSLAVGVLSWFVMSPHHLRGTPEAGAVWCADVFGGLVAGAGLMLVVVGGLALLRQHYTPKAHIPALAVHGIQGEYVALGDSYSAGEGLRPFNPGTATDCHRSEQAYSQVLTFAGLRPAERFAACSGAVVADVYRGFGRTAQVDGKVHPEVGLVTLTMSGNDVLFSKIVVACFEDRNCLTAAFEPPAPDSSGRFVQYPPSQPLLTWAATTAARVNTRVADLYVRLRGDYPKARIVVLGYPYLFPGGKPPWWLPNDCASILRRFSFAERTGIRDLMDQFNNMLYGDAVRAGLEFVSPASAWTGHEPCGRQGQYTNSIKPVISKNFIDGGTFHPNANGQRAFAYLVSCYLDTHATAPNPFADGNPRPLDITGLVKDLSAIDLVQPPGSMKAPLDCSHAG